MMGAETEIDKLITGSISSARAKYASARQLQKQAQAIPEVKGDALADQSMKLAAVYDSLATEGLAAIDKVAATDLVAGSKDPSCCPPTDENKSTTDKQTKTTVGPHPAMAQRGSAEVPATDDSDASETQKNPVEAVIERPKVAAAGAGLMSTQPQAPKRATGVQLPPSVTPVGQVGTGGGQRRGQAVGATQATRPATPGNQPGAGARTGASAPMAMPRPTKTAAEHLFEDPRFQAVAMIAQNRLNGQEELPREKVAEATGLSVEDVDALNEQFDLAIQTEKSAGTPGQLGSSVGRNAGYTGFFQTPPPAGGAPSSTAPPAQPGTASSRAGTLAGGTVAKAKSIGVVQPTSGAMKSAAADVDGEGGTSGPISTTGDVEDTSPAVEGAAEATQPNTPFIDSAAAATAFTKRQAELVSSADTLKGLFSNPVLGEEPTL